MNYLRQEYGNRLYHSIGDVLSSTVSRGLVALVLMLSGCARPTIKEGVVLKREHRPASSSFYYMPIIDIDNPTRTRNIRIHSFNPEESIIVIGGINEKGIYETREIGVDKETFKQYKEGDRYP